MTGVKARAANGKFGEIDRLIAAAAGRWARKEKRMTNERRKKERMMTRRLRLKRAKGALEGYTIIHCWRGKGMGIHEVLPLLLHFALVHLVRRKS
jgi:hypothetical protein